MIRSVRVEVSYKWPQTEINIKNKQFTRKSQQI